jgi:hypothetical protein
LVFEDFVILFYFICFFKGAASGAVAGIALLRCFRCLPRFFLTWFPERRSCIFCLLCEKSDRVCGSTSARASEREREIKIEGKKTEKKKKKTKQKERF